MKFLSLSQFVVVSLWPRISSSCTHPPQELQMCYVSGKAVRGGGGSAFSKIMGPPHPSQSQDSPLFRECPSLRAFIVRKSTATEHSNICKVLRVGGGIHKGRRCFAILGIAQHPPMWTLATKSPQP